MFAETRQEHRLSIGSRRRNFDKPILFTAEALNCRGLTNPLFAVKETMFKALNFDLWDTNLEEQNINRLQRMCVVLSMSLRLRRTEGNAGATKVEQTETRTL